MIVLLPLLAFVFASLLVVGGAMALAPDAGAAIERRLGEVTGTAVKRPFEDAGYERVAVEWLKKIGHMAPHSHKEMGKLQQKLTYAGYRNREALVVFFGIRLGCALLMFALFATPVVMRKPNLLFAIGACGVGYLLPSMTLGHLAKRRQNRIRLGLPDSLDLLVVSVEAGLGLDQALQRVSSELAFAHPDLCDELRQINF